MSGYRYFNGKKVIGGTAALLHQVKEDGGLEKHYEEVTKRAIKIIIDDTNKENIRKNIKRIK